MRYLLLLLLLFPVGAWGAACSKEAPLTTRILLPSGAERQFVGTECHVLEQLIATCDATGAESLHALTLFADGTVLEGMWVCDKLREIWAAPDYDV